jgi:hypothetical protein
VQQWLFFQEKAMYSSHYFSRKTELTAFIFSGKINAHQVAENFICSEEGLVERI